MGENWIPKIELQIIPQLPNQPLASKTFCLQNFCTFGAFHAYNPLLQELNNVNTLLIWLHMQNIWISKEIQNENSKMKIKMNFLSDFKGQTV